MSLSITHSLKNQNLFLTGCSGFLGKVLLEKILRDVPECGTIYVLVRPRKGCTVGERIEKEIYNSEIFTNQKVKNKNFKQYFNNKVVGIGGELTYNNCGINEDDMKMLLDNVNVIIHCAAVVDFNERMDKAVELNVMGALRMLDIAKKCKNCIAFMHTSTCYTSSNRPNGLVEEKLFDLGFDPQEVVDKVRRMDLAQIEKIVDTGILREWPNTYTFTKAMAEQLVFRNKGDMPLVILRPSIIGSSWREPVPGWTDVISAAGAVYASAGLGFLKFLPGSGNNVADVVPVDTVVNVMLSCLPSIIGQKGKFFVAHAGSSAEENKMTWNNAVIDIPRFFNARPSKKRLGPSEFFFVKSPQMYQLAFFMRYSVPSSILSTLSAMGAPYHSEAKQYKKLVLKSRILIETFRHFTENQWIFSNKNVKNCFYSLNAQERSIFNIDITELNWRSYNEAFSFGLLRYVFKEDLVELSATENRISLHSPPVPTDNFEPIRFLAPDLSWAYDNYRTSMLYAKTQVQRNHATMRQLVLAHPAVLEAIQFTAKAKKVKVSDIQNESVKIFDKLCGDTNLPIMSGFCYILKKIWKRLYENIEVDAEGLKAIREVSKKGPIMFVPTHRSYIDFLIISYICYTQGLPVPCIMAGEDFLGIMLVRWLFRNSGAFFVRRSFSDDKLYSAIFNAYIEQLLVDNRSIEFFVEGTRSRSGKMLHPKTGMLSVVTNVFYDKKIPDLHFVPISINYEKTVEGDLYLNELLGESKVKESLKNLLRSSSILNINFGTITVGVGEPISLKNYTSNLTGHITTLTSIPPTFMDKYQKNQLTVDNSNSPLANFDASKNKEHRKIAVREFAYNIVSKLNAHSECMPTHLVATLMLMFRQGLTHDLLSSKIEWLKNEIELRGSKVALVNSYHRDAIVTGAIKQLSSVIVERRKMMYEPLISDRSLYKNMLVLGHYRNKILHIFFYEGLFAVAFFAQLNSIKLSTSEERQVGSLSTLIKDVLFLSSLLDRENVYQSTPVQEDELHEIFQLMLQRSIFTKGPNGPNDEVSVAQNGELMFSFLCALLWPFIDSYYVSTTLLFSLQPAKQIESNLLLPRAQWLATTFYHDKKICSYESCSNETIGHAFYILEQWKVIKSDKILKNNKSGKNYSISLLQPYQDEDTLQKLIDRIDYFRKPPPVKKSSSRRTLAADMPIFAKL